MYMAYVAASCIAHDTQHGLFRGCTFLMSDEPDI